MSGASAEVLALVVEVVGQQWRRRLGRPRLLRTRGLQWRKGELSETHLGGDEGREHSSEDIRPEGDICACGAKEDDFCVRLQCEDGSGGGHIVKQSRQHFVWCDRVV